MKDLQETEGNHKQGEYSTAARNERYSDSSLERVCDHVTA